MTVHEVDAPVHGSLPPLCRPDPRDTLLGRLREVAHALPDADAIVAQDGSVTFDELLHRVYASARRIGPPSSPGMQRPLAVDAVASIESITLMLAVIASGHSLVPLDSNLPDERKQQIVDAASAVLVRVGDVIRAEDSAVPLPIVAGDRTALIAFTSGSTGTAKGVLLSHRMCLTKAYEVSSALALTPQDRIGNALPVSFGAGINTLFAGILSGATVHCRDPRTVQEHTTVDWIERSALTTLHCSPSLIRSISGVGGSRFSEDRDGPRFVTTYGEPLHSRDVEAFRSITGSRATFVNWYATTEAGAVAYKKYRPNDPLPSGFLAAGECPRTKSLDIVRSDGDLAGYGEVGQIRVSGDCFADGYLGSPDRTRERFTTGSGVLHYWTGDLGRIDHDGVLYLVGRVDDAVKIRGYRVEPAEVESALRSLPGVVDAFVGSREDSGTTELTAHFVGDTSDADVRSALREKLPEWMVPKTISAVAAIPRTDRGKVDRSALADIGTASAPAAEASGTVLVGATENWLGHIVARELELTAIHRDADFAEIGATSLVTTQILVQIRLAFHVELSPADLVDAMTVRQLARVIDERHASVDREKARGHHRSRQSMLVPLRREGSRPALFVVAGAGVPAVGLAPLAQHLEDRPVYVLQAKGLDTRAVPHRTLKGTARAFAREIRRVQPHGPYNLAGHSLGAWIALEIAHILESRGETVNRVVLVDPRLFRWLLDKLPGGTHLVAAPPEPDNPIFQTNLRVILRQTWRVVAAGVVRFTTTERWLAFGIIGAMALRRHTPRPWGGPTTVVTSETNTSDRRSWEAVVTGDLDIVQLPGHHIGLVREPVVGRLADAVDDALGARQ